ncbi:helix-turn-helix transcriptional regulator [Kitasatospora sp. CM 4170]|uniref:Helix-turn-helix transcriptional regulator n=1 Tax=Kitasatospora aburaviensis TaxID=67265 RepID=A0ABW1EY11_9ACTN|nr:helix-turn-helix transcriptional regulator [Kitasatospora sp. CM 4170]WNM47055.1 helix-turn-helix transcriptional regulator [Kitasatospora sp. CM 4170]
MPPRLSPTVRQQRLGIELRKMREHAGMTPAAMATALGTDAPKISQMENGKSGISADRLRSWAVACKCTNVSLIEALGLMTHDRGKYWWHSFRGRVPHGMLDIAELEHHAESLLVLNTTSIPGLLQTGRYASSMFARLRPPLPRHDADVRTAFRVERQQIIADGRKPLVAFVHEAALRMQFGGPEVLRDQLGSLLDDSDRPGVTVRAIPFSVDTYPGSGEDLFLAQGPVPELDTVQIDLTQGPQFIHSAAELESYRAVVAESDATALNSEDSRDFIHRILTELKG